MDDSAIWFVDDIIVYLAPRIINAVLAFGTGLVYLQFFFWVIFFAMAGTVLLAVVVSQAKTALFER